MSTRELSKHIPDHSTLWLAYLALAPDRINRKGAPPKVDDIQAVGLRDCVENKQRASYIPLPIRSSSSH